MLNNKLSVKSTQGSEIVSDKASLVASSLAFVNQKQAGRSERSSNKQPVGLSKPVSLVSSSLGNQARITKNIIPKIMGDIRHYPPANKEWKNSIYAYNKNSLRSLPALDKMATKTIKSYFSLTNNKKLARSERMRNLIRRRTVKRLFVSKPEIKQTSDKVNITVYTFNREKQFFLRKIYFYDRNMNINKNIYLYKLWLKKNLLAFKKTFKDRKSIKLLKNNKKIQTLRKNKNKTYIHNILLKKYISEGFRPLIRNNLLKSLKKRNLIRLLKKRVNKKITSARNLGMIPLSETKLLDLQSPNLKAKNGNTSLAHSSRVKQGEQYINKTFNNYFIKKLIGLKKIYLILFSLIYCFYLHFSFLPE